MIRFGSIILGWGIPLMIVLIVRAFTPDPNQPKSDFASLAFTPSKIEKVKKVAANNTDHFELQVTAPNGSIYYHRDPDPGPIDILLEQVPKDTELKIVYSETLEGNVIYELAADIAILSFESVMEEYATRRRVVYIVAGVWFLIATLLMGALWKVTKHA